MYIHRGRPLSVWYKILKEFIQKEVYVILKSLNSINEKMTT